MSGPMLLSHTGVKTVSAGLISACIDRYYFKDENMKHNAIYGISTGIGILMGSVIGSQVPDILPPSAYYNGKTIAQRSFELIFGACASYAAIQMTGSNYNSGEIHKRLGMLLLTDIGSEYFAHYLTGIQLSYFQ